jgi:hypothetical protein
MLWAGCAGCTDGMTARQMADQSMSETPELWSKAVVQRRDLGYVTQAELADVPFAVYNTETTPPTRLQVAIVEDDNAGSGNLLWDMGMGGVGGDTTMVGYGGREYTFMSARSYDYDGDGTGGTLADYADYLPDGTSDAVYDDILYAFWPATRGSRAYLHAEFTLSIFASNINLIGEDSWAFTAPAVTTTAADKSTDYAKINVYPNPYYAYNAQESNRFDKFVTFTHLPAKATIKLYTIDGTMVRKLDKDDTTQFMQWDLRNSDNLPVASGPYIALVESGDMTESKTLKVFVIQRNQVVQYY